MSGNAKKSIFKRWWFWVGSVAVVAVIGGLAGGKKNDVNKDATSTTESASNAPEKSVETPTVKITAKELYTVYDENEVSADSKYKGKRLEITGEVKDVEKTFGNVYVNLVANEFLGQVTCKLENEGDAGSLKKGETIVLIGTGDGKVGFPRIVDCKLVRK